MPPPDFGLKKVPIRKKNINTITGGEGDETLESHHIQCLKNMILYTCMKNIFLRTKTLHMKNVFLTLVISTFSFHLESTKKLTINIGLIIRPTNAT